MTFNEFALANEAAIRLAAYFGIFALMTAWEVAATRTGDGPSETWSTGGMLAISKTIT